MNYLLMLVQTNLLGDHSLRTLKVGDCLQLERRGYFRCDKAFADDSAIEFVMIPDGKTKSMSILGSKVSRKADPRNAGKQ